MPTTQKTRIPTIFHEDISLSRQSLSKIVKAVLDNPNLQSLSQITRREFFSEATSLGTNYVKAMPYYARGCGLITPKYKLTNFGTFAFRNDEQFDLANTQWAMHYHLSAHHGPGPAFWNQVVTKFFFPSNLFSKEEVSDFIGDFIWQSENKVISARKIQSTATKLLNAYTNSEGLGKLKILEATDSGRFRVQSPVTPSAWVVGYALLDFWKAQYPDRIGVSLDVLMNSGFPQLFLMAKSDLDEVLRIMQENQFVDVHRSAPPYQVMLLRQDQESILEKIYGSN